METLRSNDFPEWKALVSIERVTRTLEDKK